MFNSVENCANGANESPVRVESQFLELQNYCNDYAGNPFFLAKHLQTIYFKIVNLCIDNDCLQSISKELETLENVINIFTPDSFEIEQMTAEKNKKIKALEDKVLLYAENEKSLIKEINVRNEEIAKQNEHISKLILIVGDKDGNIPQN